MQTILRRTRGVAVAAGLALGLAVLTWLVLRAFPGAAHNGRIAGHQGMAVALAWGISGLAVALAAYRLNHTYLRAGALLVLGAALLYLVQGGLLGNARWALPAWRYGAYAAVLGSIWLAESLLQRQDREGVTGLLSLAAAGVGFLVVPFEVARWLEDPFTLPPGQFATLEMLARQEAIRTAWTVASWVVYCTLVLITGYRLGSRPARRLAAGMFAVAAAYAAYVVLI